MLWDIKIDWDPFFIFFSLSPYTLKSQYPCSLYLYYNILFIILKTTWHCNHGSKKKKYRKIINSKKWSSKLFSRHSQCAWDFVLKSLFSSWLHYVFLFSLLLCIYLCSLYVGSSIWFLLWDFFARKNFSCCTIFFETFLSHSIFDSECNFRSRNICRWFMCTKTETFLVIDGLYWAVERIFQ